MKWRKEGQTIQWPKEEGQIIQLPKEEGQKIQWSKEKKKKRTNNDVQTLHRKLKIR